MSETTNSSANSYTMRPRKRYKTGLFKNYEETYRYQVSERTRTLWDSYANIMQPTFTEQLTDSELSVSADSKNKETDEIKITPLEEVINENEMLNIHELDEFLQIDEDDGLSDNHDFQENSLNSSIENTFTDTDSLVDESDFENEKESENEMFINDTCNDELNHDLFESVMFKESNTTVLDVMTMLTAFSLRFKLSDIAKSELVNMLKLLAGPTFENCSLSNYVLSKIYNPPDDKITYHYYCSNCNKKIIYSTTKKQFRKRITVCDKCNMEDNITLRSTNYFTSIDLPFQLHMLFSYEKTKADILNYIDNMSKESSSNTMMDVSDSELYKKINQGNSKYITYNYSTDGAPLTKSGKQVFWPLQISLNCLKPILRFRYVLLGGLLTCTHEPNSDLINLYFSKFVDQVHSLYNQGITVSNLNQEDITIKFCPLLCPVDTICRPILQNRLQFNAYCGCSWCYQLGKYMKSVFGIRYPLQINDDLRTHESHLNDLKICQEQALRINQSNESITTLTINGQLKIKRN